MIAPDLRYTPYMKSLFKSLARRIIGFLAKRVLLKHNPTVIAIVGDGPTSIMREVMFSAVKESVPSRRNLELPEAEFSIPITILNYPNYPKWFGEWVWLVIKTLGQLIKIRPYKHFLVLEMHPINEAVWNYWQELTLPFAVIKVGEFAYQTKIKTLDVGATGEIEEMQGLAKRVAMTFNFDELDIDLGLETLTFPKGRIRFLRARFDGVVIDSTYYYFPIKLESVLEVANAFDGNKVIFTDDKRDWEGLDTSWKINPTDYVPQHNDVVVLRGRRTVDLKKYENLAYVNEVSK